MEPKWRSLKRARVAVPSAARQVYDRHLTVIHKYIARAESNEELVELLSSLFRFCHHTHGDSLDRACVAADSGFIDTLLSLASIYSEGYRACIKDGEEDEQEAHDYVAVLALRTLGQMCSCNAYVSDRAYRHPAFAGVMRQLSRIPNPPTQVMKYLFYLLSVVSAETWESHSLMVEMIPVCLYFLHSDCIAEDAECYARCIRFLGQLAYNPANRDILIASNAVLPLLESMRSLEVSRASVTAAAAASSILLDKTFDTLPPHCRKDVLSSILEAYTCSLDGDPFPPGSSVYFDSWKLMMAFSNLSSSPAVAGVLIQEFSLAEVVEQSLQTPIVDTVDDPELYTYFALETLWKLAMIPSQATPYN